VPKAWLDLAYNTKQESRAVARKPRDAAAIVFGLKFPNNIHYKFKSSQASKAWLLFQVPNVTVQNNLTHNAILGHSWSRVLQSVERR